MRAFRGLIIILGVPIIVATVAATWLYANPPRPHPAVAWTLGPDLPAARGELATAVAYAEPCTSTCREAERLYPTEGFGPRVRRYRQHDTTLRRRVLAKTCTSLAARPSPALSSATTTGRPSTIFGA